MKNTQKKVTEFHVRHKFPVHITLQANKNISWLLMWLICKTMTRLSKLAIWYWKVSGANKDSFYRIHLMLEELAEMMEGINNGNLIKAADGLGDTLYVIIGTGVVYSLPAFEISKEVCRSNETKQKRTKDNVRLRDKGKDWQPPDFEKALRVGRHRLENMLLEIDIENLTCEELKGKTKGGRYVVSD